MAAGDGLGHFTATQSGTFTPAANAYAVDLNRDGASDLLLYDPPTGAWQKCLSGTFACTTGSWPAGLELYPLRTKDVADGDLLLYNRSTGKAQTAVNNTAGGFAVAPASTVAAGSDVYPADFDGDGNADFLLYSASSGRWSVCLNAAGAFACQTGQWATGWAPTPFRADGNSKSQVLIYNPASQATAVARFTGTSFTVTAIPSASRSLLFRAGDFNADGKDDLLMCDEAKGTIAQTINVGPNQFQVYTVATLPGSSATAQR
jgi:hypothetical protein